MVSSAGSTGPVVSNTSPLISLASVGLLHLLGELYGSILIPTAVRDEYELGRRLSEPPLGESWWATIVAVDPDPALAAILDLGEAAAISLAKQSGARAIILDERIGRRVAEQLGLLIVGTVGVLPRAKEGGLLANVQPILDEMIARGVRISPHLRVQVLRALGELP